MQSGEVVGTEQFAGVTPADAARWLLALVVVAGLGSGLVRLAPEALSAGDEFSDAAPPAMLIELAPVPEPAAAPMPEPAEPEIEPPSPEPDPEPVVEPEPIVEPAPEPPPPVEEPPEPVVPDEPPPEPELAPEPAPVPEAEAPAMAFPLPATMSAALQQQRQDTQATKPPPPRRPAVEPEPPPQSAAAPAPQQAVAAAGPSPQEWQQQVLRYLDRRKVYPRNARRAGQEGVVAINFTIDAVGRVLAASVSRSSGFPALDQAAVDTARRASPLPAPPASLGGSISLTASIRFTLR